jgi:GR25 family glycosyltransferase involved in LPS biosynthesis
MMAFVINLDRRPERMEAISKTLRALDIPFERVAAIDGQIVDVWQEANKMGARIYDDLKLPPRGMIAAFLSHRKVWSEVVARKLPEALIFEDDVVATNFDPAVMSIDLASFGLDLLRLEELALPYRVSMKANSFSVPMLGRHAVGCPSYGLAAYIVSLKGAKKLLKAEKFWFNPDHFDIWKVVYGVETAVLRPNMFGQADFGSDTGENDRYPGTIQGIVGDFVSKREPSLARTMKRLKRWSVNAVFDILSFIPKRLLLLSLSKRGRMHEP